MSTPDFIIIGAGSAGCVLANRLSADPAIQVVLLEAGGPDKFPLIRIPNAYGKLFRTPIDWGLWSEEQEHLEGRKLYLPRGKTLGGSSSTNAMAYVRGNRADYDDWAAAGNAGWDFESILPYFMRSEHNEQHDQLDEGYHGQDGPLNVTFAQKFQTPFARAFVDACGESGIPFTADYNGAKQTGAGFFQFTIKDQQRHSTAAAFLHPVMDRPNLRVITGAQVERILLDKDRAVGVAYRTTSGPAELRANKEVLLSAGAFHSPQLLLLSGIGDPDELAQHNIECKRPLPGVGKNLQDHLFYAVSATSGKRAGQNHVLQPWSQFVSLLRYLFVKSGPLTISPLEAVAFFNIDQMGERVDTEFHFASLHIGGDYNYDMYDLRTYPKTPDGFTILPSLLRPKSRGYVGLRSDDPQDTPLIQPNFLSEEDDLVHLVKGGKRALEVLAQPSFRPYLKEVIMPQDSSSDDAIADHIRRSVETIYHPVGTCKMGNDEMAVVDNELRVHGLEGLRVVDASIMPTIVSGNTNAPVIMIAEKAADLLMQ